MIAAQIKSILANTRNRKNFFFLALSMLLGATLAPHTTFAVGLEASGWIDFPDSENLGATASCAAGENYSNFVIKEYNSEATTTAPWVGVYLYRNNAFWTAVGGPSLSETPPVCFNPLTDTADVYVYGSSQYYDFHLPVSVSTSTPITTGNRIRSHIHLKPRTLPNQDVEYLSPISINSNSWINTDPAYKVAVKSFPSVHSATNVKRINGFTLNSSGNLVQTWQIEGGGGVNTYTSASSPLSDGLYYWVASTALNFPVPSGRPFSSTPVYFDTSSGNIYSLYQTVRIDKTLPTATLSHSPASPIEGDAVIVSGVVGDVMSGLYSAQVYVDGGLEKNCTYAGEPSATCSANAKTYSVGTHTYKVTAQDRASNVFTVSTGTFTVSPSVVASCSPTHYACSTGTSANNVDGVTTWTWDCLGAGSNGVNAICFESKPNPAPVVLFPNSSQTITLADSVIYTGSASDANGDMDQIAFNWKNPDGTFNWTSGSSYQGTVTSGPYFNYGTPVGNANFTTTFTPTSVGVYEVYAVAHDANGWAYSSGPYYTLTVVAPIPAAPTVNIWSDQNPIVYNTSTTVRWTSTDTTTCVAPGGSTSTSGNYVTPPLTTTTTYNISCTGPGGTINDFRNVVVIPNLDGACGPLSGTSSVTAPAPTDPDLCTYTNGTPTISGSGPWTWKCLGSGTGVDSPTCSMTKILLSCGNNTCEKPLGESVLTCPQDCRVKFKNF